MRESNFAFPAQNRACVCISSQLYDRRALDTNSPLPLFNSLTHLTYLTSTSPRIREIMTMDGGLERLVRIIHDFCMCPPPPENPTLLYGLSPPSSHPPKLTPTLIPKQFDKHAAYRFSLAFQCVVNIGVRGSEPIRSRVVQAGTLEVVGCILEGWLVSHGFSVTGNPHGGHRESRQQRLARRQAQEEARQREQTAELELALRQMNRAARLERGQEEEAMDVDNTDAARVDTDESAETSSNATPGTNTPTGSVVVPSRDRSGTVIARPTWDIPQPATGIINLPRRPHRARPTAAADSRGASTSTSADNSRPETETEDDGDVDMDRESSPVTERRNSTDTATVRGAPIHPRRAVGIVSDTTPAPPAAASLDMNTDAHIIINADQGVAVEGVGVEDGIVSLETNDDFAMGAPPGAPGAIDGLPRTAGEPHPGAGERTPRAGAANLPLVVPTQPLPSTTRTEPGGTRTTGTGTQRTHATRGTNTPTATVAPIPTTHAEAHRHSREETGPYRDEDVLLGLQLLAYLSKYPHVRQAFYKQRPSFHSAAAPLYNGGSQPIAGPSGTKVVVIGVSTGPGKEPNSFMKALQSATGRGKEKEKASAPAVASAASQRMTNVFALVERFTFRPSSSDVDSVNAPATLPPEIQYWAGVIMRNACRKDDSRGGIRQCANMLCGRWESYPREFAKCRRCRKAKYCGKECQSTAWSEGHRFWCSAKETEEDPEHQATANGTAGLAVAHGGTVAGRAERRAQRERERQAHAEAQMQTRTAMGAMRTAVSALRLDPDATVALAPQPATTTTATTARADQPVQTVQPAATQTGRTGPAAWAASILTLRRPPAGAAAADPAGGTADAMTRLAMTDQGARSATSSPGRGAAGPSTSMGDGSDDMVLG
ncbi:hypothetical protein CERSUDRAFT_108147 [Gelatoporia subvermispora B]|uniref:MYND-type domain-containing protein n=1 Tax=Ceriporiopsis subvermispora (strain B) TaxID=914234 RepID=M2R367_CERS8|nr:hypothetical protein CERSUDRAFT_108147 [Gelatoporia subvermispora B]